MKPITGDAARLVDISRTGLQLETTARLAPGRRSAVVLVDADDRTVRAEGLVVWTQLAGLGPTGACIYRTALSFTEAIDLRLPGSFGRAELAPVDAADIGSILEDSPVEPLPDQPLLEGPLTAVWASDTTSATASVSRLTEVGCFVEVTKGLSERERAALTVFFSPGRSLRLPGEVVAVEQSRGGVLRFAQLPADVRRSLRVEIREGARTAPLIGAALSLTQRDGVLGTVRVAWPAHGSGTHANQW